MPNSLLKKNIFANFFGNTWGSLMGLVFVPFYIHFLGIEAYGLIAIFGTLQAMFAILDMGITPTINREMARLSAKPGGAQQMRDLIRTIELIYWAIAVIIGVVVISLSSFIAQKWINTTHLSSGVIQDAVYIMGVCVFFRWPLSLYSGALMGLQQQVLFNKIGVIINTAGSAVTLIFLWLVSPTIKMFFICQIVISLIHTLTVGLTLWRKVPEGEGRAIVNWGLIPGIWRFSAGSGGTAFLGVILSQMDKIILSRMLPLDVFGYYSIASAIATRLKSIYGPVTIAIYPHFSRLVELDNQEQLRGIYHKGCQFMSILIFPVAAIIAFFSHEILLLWMQNQEIAEQASLIVSILVAGRALNGVLQLPYMLQLAHGWTSLGFFVNLFAVILLVPLLVLMTTYYGVYGAAGVWLILNIGYISISIQIMHHKIFPADKWVWYGVDVGLPMLIAFTIAGIWRLMYSDFSNNYYMFLSLVCTSILSLFCTAIATPFGRELMMGLLQKVAPIYLLNMMQKKRGL